MNYKTKSEMAIDAFDIINQMMGELQAARMTNFLVSDQFLDSPKLNGLKERIGESRRVFIRRMALSTVASVMFRWKELYDYFLKQLDCHSDDAKAFLRSVSREKLEELRHANEHLLDKDTGRFHTLDKIENIFSSLNQNNPDLMEQGISENIKRLEKIRDQIEKKYPGSKEAMEKKYKNP